MPANRRFRPPTEERLIKAAVYYLERYASTEANLRKVLERKVFRACQALDLDPSEFCGMIEAVVGKCGRTGLVNDQTFAEMKVASLRRKGHSRKKIEAHLKAKGVSGHVLDKALADDVSDDQKAAISYAKRRRLGPFGDPAKRMDRRQRDMAAMCRAGFDYGMARSVIDAEQTELLAISV